MNPFERYSDECNAEKHRSFWQNSFNSYTLNQIQDFRAEELPLHDVQRVPAHHSLLALHHVPLTYDEAAIQEILDCVTPSTVRIMWSSKDFQASTSSAK